MIRRFDAPETSNRASTISNSTITEGILVYRTEDTLRISNSTVAGDGLELDYQSEMPVFVESSIVSAVSDFSDDGIIRSRGYNIFGSQIGPHELHPTDLVSANTGLSEALIDHRGRKYFAVLPDSPVIDRGSNPDGLQFDQLGNQRVTDGDGNGDATIDIGAVEYSSTLVVNDFFHLNIAGPPPVDFNLLKNDSTFTDNELRLTSINGQSDGVAPGLYGEIRWDDDGNLEYRSTHPLLIGLSPDQMLVDSFDYLMSDGVSEAKGRVEISLSNDAASLGVFGASQSLETETRNDDVDLGDLDNDGDLDAFITVRNGGNQVWWNDGEGHFSNSGQSLGSDANVYAALGDLDDDGDLDAVVAALTYVVIWENDGTGQFSESQRFEVDSAIDVGVGDLDRDGFVDVFVAQNSAGDLILLNDGSGGLVDSGQILGDSQSKGVTLMDLDNRRGLEAVVATANDGQGAGNFVWYRRNSGQFNERRPFGDSETQHVALGDLDGDGYPDAFSANSVGGHEPNRVWINDGHTIGTRSTEQRLGNASTSHIALGDFDNDGDLDAFAANWANQADQVWINDGTGLFHPGQSLGSTISSHVALGDINGDGMLDALVATFEPEEPVVVWINQAGQDFDGNGIVDSDDIDHICLAVREGSDDERFDLDGNGEVNAADFDSYLALRQIGRGDATADGVTDVSDFARWNGNKFTSNDPELAGVGWATGDLNCDGVTDVSDFNLWNEHKFTSADRVGSSSDNSQGENGNGFSFASESAASERSSRDVIELVFANILTDG